MKLLFFSQTLKGGGAERVLSNLTNELVKRGHSITIALNDNQTYYKIDDRIVILPQKQRNLYYGNNYIKRIIRRLMQERYNYCHTRYAIKRVRPDIIISFLQCNMLAILLCKGRIPVIHSEHNAYDRKLGLWKMFCRFYLNRFFTKVCVLTQFDQGYACAKGLNNTIVMPNPNTFDSISKDQYDILFPQRKNILACGRVSFWYIKGLDIAIESFARVANRIPGVDLDIVGYGDEKSIEYLKKLADKFEISHRVHFLGQQNEMLSIYRQHKVLILSSRTEGFPMVITEAMSQGCPCIAFERLAFSIISDKIDGLLAKSGDIETFSEYIYELISNNQRCKAYGKAAYKNITRFSVTQIADRWEDLFTLVHS